MRNGKIKVEKMNLKVGNSKIKLDIQFYSWKKINFKVGNSNYEVGNAKIIVGNFNFKVWKMIFKVGIYN